MNQLTKGETDSQNQKTKLGLPEGEAGGRDQLRACVTLHNNMYKIGNQQGPTVEQGRSTQHSEITYMRKVAKGNRYIQNGKRSSTHTKAKHFFKQLTKLKTKLIKTKGNETQAYGRLSWHTPHLFTTQKHHFH